MSNHLSVLGPEPLTKIISLSTFPSSGTDSLPFNTYLSKDGISKILSTLLLLYFSILIFSIISKASFLLTKSFALNFPLSSVKNPDFTADFIFSAAQDWVSELFSLISKVYVDKVQTLDIIAAASALVILLFG